MYIMKTETEYQNELNEQLDRIATILEEFVV
jgi:hypothetical protein